MQRKINTPSEIQLMAEDGAPLIGPRAKLTFELFLQLVWQNPIWNQDWQHGLAQRSIRASFKAAQESNTLFFMLAEDDWAKLDLAVKNPRIVRQTINGPELVPGFGYDASLASQILPMQLAIIEAQTV